MAEKPDTESVTTAPSAPPRGYGLALPSWFDARTITMLTTTVTVALTLGTMMQTAHSHLAREINQLRQDMREEMGNMRLEFRSDGEKMHHGLSTDIETVRHELSADIDKVRHELSADIDKVRHELGADIKKLDERLRSVEVDVAAIRAVIVGLDHRPQERPAAPAAGRRDTGLQAPRGS